MEPFFKILDLPDPPQWLIDEVNSSTYPNPLTNGQGYVKLETDADWNDQEYTWLQPMNPFIARHVFNSQSIEWFRENISKNFNPKNSGWMYMTQPLPCHTDLTREWALLYNVIPGGENVELRFWQEAGQPLYREGHNAWDSNEGFELIETHIGPFNCWYLIRTTVVHSIHNLSGIRLNLQLSYDRGSIPDIL